jgi:hypothetical protein
MTAVKCAVLAVCVSRVAPASRRIYGKVHFDAEPDREAFLISGLTSLGSYAPSWYSELGKLCGYSWEYVVTLAVFR